MWLLKSDGTLGPDDTFEAELELAADAPVDEVPDAQSILVLFGGTADGRGFSVARHLRARGYAGTLTAAGPLIPDQARNAFQSGFDQVAIADDRLARHGEAAWREALNHSVRSLYFADATSRAGERSIWALRHVS